MTDKEFRCLCRGDLIKIICDKQKKQLSLKQENKIFRKGPLANVCSDVIMKL